jgi:multiple sugar transport system substrate-binding protein
MAIDIFKFRYFKIGHWQKVALSIVSISILFFASGCQDRVDQNITTITLWHGINPPENRDVFNELVAEFNRENTDIRVESLYIGQPDGQMPKILAATVSNQPPNLLWFVAQLTGQLVQLDALLPLEDWLNRSPIALEIDPSMFASMELDNHIYSIPFATNNTAMFYRPSFFQQAGIKNLPKTWTELKIAAEKLTQDTDNDGRIDRHGLSLSLGKGEWTVFAWLPFIFSAGGELIDNNNLPNIVNRGTIEALEFGRDLVNNKLAILSAPERGYELDNFINGKVAMQITGPWTLGQLQSTKIDYDVFPIPKQKENVAVMGGENLFLFKTNSDRERASLRFLEYVLSEKFQTEWALKTGYLPINIKAQQSKAYQEFVALNPALKVFLDQMKYARSRPIIPKYSRLSENLGRAIEASLLNRRTPQTALTESQARLDEIFVK